MINVKKIFVVMIMLFGVCAVPEAFAAEPEISAAAACVMDADNGDILYEKKSDERLPMASTTKIMTALLVIERCDLNGIVTVSANAASAEGSSAYLNAGDRIYARDLLYGLMLNSGNDAAVAAAEYAAGSEEKFTVMMNERAAELGLSNTSFENASGLDGENHYTTAEDLARLACAALENETFREIVSCRSKTITLAQTDNRLTFTNHNRLLAGYEGAIGVKTGFTKKCGRCLVSAAQRGGKTIAAVTLNDGNDWLDHKNLLDYGFSCMKEITVMNKGDVLGERSADDKKHKLVAADTVVFTAAGKKSDFEIITHLAPKLIPPIEKGEKVGYAEVCYKGKTRACVDIVSEEEIDVTAPEKTSFIESFLNAVKSIFSTLNI